MHWQGVFWLALVGRFIASPRVIVCVYMFYRGPHSFAQVMVGRVIVGIGIGLGELNEKYNHHRLPAIATSSLLPQFFSRPITHTHIIPTGLSIDPLYISEVAPPSHRGHLVSFSEVAINMGVLLGTYGRGFL